MSESRINIRYNTIARAHIHDISDADALVKDISITGCCIEYTMSVDITMNSQYTIQIIPEPASKIGKFEILVESRWIRTGEYSCDYGFIITASPKGKSFQRYVDYLTWRSILL
ncbi:MAG: PilZ domain-containing protein [Treponema sp.]|jgi:hypothetical protein|nr:PilZ domain-containing protein [Treponema sp.]